MYNRNVCLGVGFQESLNLSPEGKPKSSFLWARHFLWGFFLGAYVYRLLFLTKLGVGKGKAAFEPNSSTG